MRSALCFPLLLIGCASTDLDNIKHQVDSRIAYQAYQASDWRYVPRGTTAQGNCAVYAYTYYTEAKAAGLQPTLHTCLLRGGEFHAYTEVDGLRLDNRHRHPVRDNGCMPVTIRSVKL